MSDALLPYYNRELQAIRALAAEFAAANPKVAGRLRLSADGVDDPHVARLLEGVAFLAGRVHHRLDDELPELTDALLGTLYPHYLAPMPSCTIVQLLAKPELTAPVTVPAGLALDTEKVRSEACRFRTAYPVTLWPINIESLRLSGLPLTAPSNPAARGAAGVLRIGLRCRTDEGDLAELGLDRVRFYLRAPSLLALPLYELLTAHVVSVAVADGAGDPAPTLLPPSAISPAGFEADEALLPWPARSFSGFRLLGEYFAFPEKFLFIDVTGLDARTLVTGGNRVDLFIYLDRSSPELERALGSDALALGCTPAVNLFAQRCEPVALTHVTTEYRIEPDARRPGALEIWSIDRVVETQPDGTARHWQPFHRLAADGCDLANSRAPSYGLARRPTRALASGTDMFMAPFDPAFDAEAPADAILSVDATCSNRDLPVDLPFGGGHPFLQLVDGVAAVESVACLTPPTATLRVPLRERGFWRLVSHLSLGHLSVVDGAAGAAALREVLRLYDLRDSAETRAAIEGLLAVSAKPGTARVPGDRFGSFCRGLDVTLEFDRRAWGASGLCLLAAVLERFLALHATVNGFVRSRAVLRGVPDPAVTWPARAGARTLL